jgi:hypothetical protein
VAAVTDNILEQVGYGIAGPPYKFRQNETIYWEDVAYSDRFNNSMDSLSYLLTYAFAGPVAQPFTINAVPASTAGTEGLGGGGWTTQLTPAQAALFTPAGKYWWQAILTGLSATFTGTIVGNTLTVSGVTGTICQGAVLTGGIAGTTIVNGSGTSWQVDTAQNVGPVAMSCVVTPQRIVAAEGECIIEPDLSAQTGVFDGRSASEISLDLWQAAYQALATNGVKSYEIAGRRMMYRDLPEIQKAIDYYRSRVFAEKSAASGGQRRLIRQGFSPPSSGTQTSNSRNWPWW